MRWISERSGLKERSNKHSRINGLYPIGTVRFCVNIWYLVTDIMKKILKKTRLSCIIVLLKIGMIKNEKTDNQNPKRKIDWICK